MSYIFDALKKSEEQQQNRLFRPAPSPQKTQEAYKKKLLRSLLIGLPLILLILGAGIIVFAPEKAMNALLLMQKRNRTEIQQSVVASSLSTPAPESSSSPPVSMEKPATPTAPPATPPSTTEEIPRIRLDAERQKHLLMPQTTTESQEESKSTAQTAQALSANTEQDGETPQTSSALSQEIAEANAKYRDIPYYEDLDQAVKDQLPELKLYGHTYAKDPARRMILINNAIVHEKGTVANTLFLKEILPNSIILCKKDFCFRLAAH